MGGPRTEHGRIPTSARQSPPSATASDTSSRIFPGSCTALGFRHGASRRYRLVQAGLADRFDQQHTAGLGDHPATTALGTDRWVGPDALHHLESASFMRQPAP